MYNDLVIIPIGSPYIADIMSIKPNDINAKIIVDKESILTYSENEISTSKSYVIKLPLDNLIRITCNDETLREKYNLENINELSDTNVDLSVLFDNVRGFVTKSKYNTKRPEQIQLEQYLNEKNIIYSRKTGDTGLDDTKTYTHKISMERFGQLLYSLQGFPEKASNQKKQIFDKKYDEIFAEPNFILEESDEIVNKYFEIKNIY